MSPLEPVHPIRTRLVVAVGLALAAALALWPTGFHVVPTQDGRWSGLTDAPGPARALAALTLGLLAGIALRRAPSAVLRPLLVSGLAALPLASVLTGGLHLLLLFQGAALVPPGLGALAYAIVRQGTLLRTRVPDITPAALFLVALAFYALLGTRLPGAAGPQGDEPHYLVMAESLLSDGDVDLADEFGRRDYAPFFAGTLRAHTSPASPPGTIYPVHAPGLPLLILPAYAAGGYTGARLMVSAAAALAAALVYALVRPAFGAAGALATWAIAALTPPLALYAVSIYPETFAATATAAFLLLSRRDASPWTAATAGLIAAALPWLHPKLLPLAVLGLLFVVVRPGPLLPRAVSVLALGASVGGLLAFLGRTYGRAALSAAYGPGFESDVTAARLPWGAAALLLDRQFGLLFVGPVWALAFAGFPTLLRRQPAEALRALALGASTFAAGASFSMWWGGSCPPARFVVPALPALALALAPALRARPGVGAALGGAALAVVAIAADAPRALHNRADGESALLRHLAPALDLDATLPSFVLGGPATVPLAATLAAALALGWARGRRGLLAGGAAFFLLAVAVRDRPLLDPRQATLRLLAAYDPDVVSPIRGPLRLEALAVDLDLRDPPWRLQAGDVRNSRRLDVPPGLYAYHVDGRVLEAQPGARTARIDLTASELPLLRSYLRGGAPPPTEPLLLPVGARRLMATAVGVQGESAVDTIRLVPRALLPRSTRDAFAWPRAPEPDRYRVEAGALRVTALDRSAPDGNGFRLEGEEARFVVDGAPGTVARIEVARPEPRPQDALQWGAEHVRLGPSPRVRLERELAAGVGLGESALVAVRLRAYGSWIRFSGSLGGTRDTESSSASPAARPRVTSTSGPPDSGK